jgi:hypothetical protein
MANPSVYLAGRAAPPTPLERYLPPLPAGVIAAWLEANVPKGAWVLDPFGTSPLLAVEAARAGNRVIVAANNPVTRFLMEMRALAPSADDLRAALAELAASRRGEERLEPAILDLYMTVCPKCGAQTPADAFIWERDAAAPHTKIVNCKACNEAGEYPTDEADQTRAAEYQRGGPHLSRLLQRIAPPGDPDREHADEALTAYLPRAVYALFSIINRIDGLQTSDEQRRLIHALVLSACDRATSLWAHPTGRMRPKQLSAPAQFREYNLWHEMERSIDLWAVEGDAVPLDLWPRPAPEAGGISLYEGRLRDLAEELSGPEIQAVVTAFPRPNQAFWTLCALWAGWLWGRDTIGPFALVLRRKRYDWAWHTEALTSALSSLTNVVKPDTQFFGVVTESEPGFNAAVFAAANLTDFRIEGLSLRREDAILQANWRKGLEAPRLSATEPAVAIRRSARGVLSSRGEPSNFVYLHAAGLAELSKRPQLGLERSDPSDLYAMLRETLEVALTYRGSFLRFDTSEQSLETGLWWLEDASEARSPLADRVEIATVRHLLRRPGRTFEEIDAALSAVFPGSLTPPASLIRMVLNSYGAESEGRWQLAESEQPRTRRRDLHEIRSSIAGLGQRLGYEVDKGDVLQWRAKKKAALSFYPIASAVLGDLILNAQTDPATSIIVLPGRRAQLALSKIDRDPRLQQAVKDGWRFVKFRHVRRLAANMTLTPESFNELIDLDPLALEQLQAPLL